MHIVKNGLCLMMTVIFVGLPMFALQKAPVSSVQSEFDIVRHYIMGLQEHREKCYERILFLGMVSDRELTVVKRELEIYLGGIYSIQRQVIQMGI